MKKELKRRRSKEEKGITLIALVITIIILLILAGVTLNAALSENGLFKKAKYAAEEYNEKAIEEQVQLLMAEKELESVSNGTNQKADITSLLEEVKETDGKITEQDIQDFNDKYLQDYGEEIKPVRSKEDLENMREDLDGIYVQVAEIDLTDVESFIPIGTKTFDEEGNITKDEPFTGVYNGNGYSVDNLKITATIDASGMFGWSEGTIKNVTIKNCNITTEEQSIVGAIVGYNSGLIENCEVVNGSVSGSLGNGMNDPSDIGGICGNSAGIIRGCVNKCNVTGSWNSGGICGFSTGNISDCSNEGNIKGGGAIGGIVGTTRTDEAYTSNCHNHGTITTTSEGWKGQGRNGGVVGFFGGTVINCSNDGNITGDDWSGGIAGSIGDMSGNQVGHMENCWNSGKIEGNNGARISSTDVLWLYETLFEFKK